MAYVYADMGALAEFQQSIAQTLFTLEGQVGCNEDLIKNTKVKIRAAIEQAEEEERAAYTSLRNAEDMLREAERQTPTAIPEFCFENVTENRQEYAHARANREYAEKTLSEFETYVRRYEQRQLDGIEHIRKLLDTSGKFFDCYIQKLVEVKKCTAGSGSSSANSNVKVKAVSSNDVQSARPDIVLHGKSIGADGEEHDYHTEIYFSDTPSNIPMPPSFGCDSAQIQAWGNQHYARWISSLSLQEKAAIRCYTGEDDESYRNINTNLRAGIPLNYREGNLVSSIHSALSRAALPHDVQVYRALDDNGIRELALYCNQGKLEAGATLQDPAFMSCSLLANNLFNTCQSNKYILRLTATEGLHAAYVNKVSSYAAEQELLVDKDHSIFITGITQCARKEITQYAWDNDTITIIDGVLSI